MSASPTAAYARLHYLIPLALVAVGASVIVALRLPEHRDVRPGSVLIQSSRIKSETLKHNYKQVFAAFKRQLPADHESGRITRAKLGPLRERMKRIAEQAKLRCSYYSPYFEYAEPYCDTRVVFAENVLTIFWAWLIPVAICAVLWLFVQFRESWMLPYWNSHLWYTPAYVVALAAIGIAPFLMLGVHQYHARQYVLGASELRFDRLGVVFYALVFLQFTALCVAAVELRPSAMRFLIGVPTLLLVGGVAGGLYVVAFLLFGVTFPREPYNWLDPVLVGVLAAFGGLVGWLARRRRASGRARAPYIHRVFQLSQVLLIAWFVYAIDAVLGPARAPTGAGHELLRTLCLALCVAHLIRSRWAELRFAGPLIGAP